MPRRNKRSNDYYSSDSFTDGFDTLDALSLSSPTRAIMIGCTCPHGPGGRDCTCCGDAPGKPRTAARRAKKRSKRQEFKRSLRQYNCRSYREYLAYEGED